MTGKILKWTERRYDQLVSNEDTKFKGVKVFGLCALEGIVDAAVVLGSVTLVYSTGNLIKDLIKK